MPVRVEDRRGERSILSQLIDTRPAALPVAVVGEASNYSRRSYETYIQRLVARRLVVRQRRDVRASEGLFDNRVAG